MKKILGIIVLGLLLSINAQAASKWGKGELQLDDFVVEKFIKYLRGNTSTSPHLFAVSIDGWGFLYYYCSSGTGCEGGSEQILEECSKRSKDIECFLFARKRTIKWKNGINPAKGKASTIKSKWSDTEIKAKLTELGFYKNNNISSSTTNKKIIEGVVYFNKCSWSLNEEDYHWSFEVDLNKGSHLKEVFFAKGEIYKDKFKIILNNDDFIKTKIKSYGEKTYIQYEFNKKKDEITKFIYNDKKGNDKNDTSVLICNEIVGTLNSLETEPKKNKKEPKKVKKYELKGERSIALSWDGYEDLIAGTVKFDEADYKGTLSIPLPNNDGTCDGTYSLQEGGKGTWQIACSNNMGAAGTLKWTKNGGVTGSGRDHNDKKVKFTVSKKS
jgi:hypothetical protein